MTAHYSPAESQAPEQREQALLAALPDFLAHAKKHAPACAKLLEHINPQNITSREALADVPVVNKAELIAAQEASPPFAGYDCFDFGTPQCFYLSPGPIAECDFAGEDYWRTAAAFWAAGLRPGMILHNSFSYHFTPAGRMCESGALALGARVFPAGAGNSEQQAQALARFGAHCYSGTPDFLRIILQQADELGADVSSLTMASVSGGYLSPELRQFYESRGIAARQWYGTADCGLIALETQPGAPLIVAEGLLVEVVDPKTRRLCAPGEKGEVLLTNFNRAFPLIRFALGDLSAVTEGISPCGRTSMRLAGWLGRCDLSVKVRGMFVHPAQVERLLARFPAVQAGQLSITSRNGLDEMTLLCAAEEEPGRREALIKALQEETKLRGEVQFAGQVSGDLIKDNRELD